jgi:hypothetical protein
MRSTRGPWTWHAARPWWRPILLSRRRRGLPSTRVSGRAAMLQPALSAGTTTTHIAIPTVTRLSRAGPIPGWSNSPDAAPVGLLPYEYGGSRRGRASTALRRSRSVPGCTKRYPVAPSATRRHCADRRVRRRLRSGPTEPGPGEPAGLSPGALARWSLFLRRPARSATDGTTTSTWGKIRLRRGGNLASADERVDQCRRAVRAGQPAGLERAARGPAKPCQPRYASSAAPGSRDAHSSRSGASATTDQRSHPTVVLVVRPHPTRLSGGLAGLHRPLLDGTPVSFLQADAALDDAQSALTHRR